MTDHPESVHPDDDFFAPDERPAEFDDIPEQSSGASMDAFDDIKEERDDSEEGTISQPEPIRKKFLTPKVLKIGGGIGIAGVLTATAIIFGPSLLSGGKPSESAGQGGGAQGGVQTVMKDDGKQFGEDTRGQKREDVKKPEDSRKDGTFDAKVAELTKGLQSEIAAEKQKTRQEILTSFGSRPEEVAALKQFKQLTAKLVERDDPDPDDVVTDFTLDLMLEERGADKETKSSEAGGVRLKPEFRMVVEKDAPQMVGLPFPYSILFAVLGADKADADPMVNKLKESLQNPAISNMNRCMTHLKLVERYLKASDVDNAFHHLQQAEKDQDSKTQAFAAKLRRRVVDAALERVLNDAKEVKKVQDSVAPTNVRAAVRSLLVTQTLQSLDDDTPKPDQITGEDWKDARERIQVLKSLDTDQKWNDQAEEALLADYYRLSRIQAAVTHAKIDNFGARFDDAIRVSIRTLLDRSDPDADSAEPKPGSLADRLNNCKPTDEATTMKLTEAKETVAEMVKDEYVKAKLPKLDNAQLRVDYEKLRKIELNLIAWEARQFIDDVLMSYLDSETSTGKIAELVKKGIAAELRPKGLLANLAAPKDADPDAETRRAFKALADSLAERLAKYDMVKDDVKDELVTEIQANREKELKELDGDELKDEYKGLQAVESKVLGWEIANLVKSGIAEEKGDGKLLADLKKLAKVKEPIPEDVVGRAEVKTMITLSGMSNPGPGTGTGTPPGGGVNLAKIEEIIKNVVRSSEERIQLKVQDTVHDAVDARVAKLESRLVELEGNIKESRPISTEQLEELDRRSQKLIGDELARRGILPVPLPSCNLPKGPASDPNRRKAYYQFGQGCACFYSQSREQMPAATRFFSEATSLEPYDPIYRYFLGCSLYCEGRPEDALMQVRCAAELEKRRDISPEVSLGLERVQFGTRQWLERCRQSALLGL